MSERIVIETPENIAFGYDVAGIGSRFLAALIDTLIQGSIMLVLLIAYLLLGMESVFLNLPPEVTLFLPALVVLTLFIIWFGYYIAFEIFMSGQSPGKRLLNLRVIKENGYPLGVVDSVIRNMVRAFDFFPFAYGVGVVVMFLNDRAKRLGDFAAGTLVVNVHEQVKLVDLQAASARVAMAPTPAAPVPEVSGLQNLRPSDIDLIESYLLRRPQLRNADALGAQIAAQIGARLNADLPSAGNGGGNGAQAERPEVFLQQVVTAYRATHARR